MNIVSKTPLVRAEIKLLARQHGLTKHEMATAMMHLDGKAAFPLRCYCEQVRRFVAFIREQQEPETL